MLRTPQAMRDCKNVCLTGIFASVRHLVYPATWQTDNHGPNHVPLDACIPARLGPLKTLMARSARWTPGLPIVQGDLRGIISPGPDAPARERGRRRTRQGQISPRRKPPVKLRTSRSAPNEECQQSNAGFFCRTVFREERTLSKLRSGRLT